MGALRGLGLAVGVWAGCAHPRFPKSDPALGPSPPFVIAPDDEASTSARPTFRWELAPGTDEAWLEVCNNSACGRKLVDLPVRGNSYTPPEDLPAGPATWRLWGRTHGSFGQQPTPRRQLAIGGGANGFVEVTGKHVIIAAPRDERDAATSLASLADQATVFFAELFGRALPAIPTPIYLYPTEEAYRKAAARLSHGRMRHATAFSTGPGVVHQPFMSDVDLLRTVMLHELAHSYQEAVFHHYDDEPPWMIEGMAELLAERALELAVGPSAAESRQFASRVRAVRQAIEDGKLIPLAKLFNLERDFLDGEDAQAINSFYAESYCTLAMIDSPASPERQKRFRAFLRDDLKINGFLVMSRINKKFAATFGSPAALERELREWIAAQPR